MTSPPSLRSQLAAAIESVGSHRWVRLEVTGAELVGHGLAIDLVIHYAIATPVCCGQPGCYLPFLGTARDRLPDAVGTALGIERPNVTIRVELRHEPGYRYINHATGQLADVGIDHVQTYGPDHFAPRDQSHHTNAR